MKVGFYHMKKELNLSLAIRRIRNSLGFSQGYVAKKLKVSQQAYSQMENAPEKVTIERLKEICEVFNVDLFTMLTEGKAPGKKSSARAAQHNARFKEIMSQAQIIAAIKDMNKKLDAMMKESKDPQGES
jgi:transcriptional regulator with XRE-family HTH domain